MSDLSSSNFVDLDKFAVATSWSTTLGALNAGIRHGARIELNRANGIVIARDHVIHTLWITVGVYDSNHGDLQVVCFGNRNTLVLDVDNEQCVRQTTHILNTTNTALQLQL